MSSTEAASDKPLKRRSVQVATGAALVLVLALGSWLRYSNAASAPLEGIEIFEFIPASLTLSWDHHPIRAAQHGAVPIYLIRLSSALFGRSDLGFRMLDVAAGAATILMLFLIARRWWGAVAGLVAAALLAVDRYHIAISARAIDLSFDLFFVSCAIYCLARFYERADPAARRAAGGWWLYGAGAAIALGFLCKEFTALMVPISAVCLLATGHAAWFRRREPWLAMGLFLLLIAPDIYSNLTITRAERMALLSRQQNAWTTRGAVLSDPESVVDGFYMSYGDQLSRFRSIGFNPEPFYFYFGDLLNDIGVAHGNEFDEFPFMHPGLAIALWTAVLVHLVRRRKDAMVTAMLVFFFFQFMPFALVQLGPPRGTFPTDSQALWYWVDRTMLPGMLLTGALVAALFRTGRSTNLNRLDSQTSGAPDADHVPSA